MLGCFLMWFRAILLLQKHVSDTEVHAPDQEHEDLCSDDSPEHSHVDKRPQIPCVTTRHSIYQLRDQKAKILPAWISQTVPRINMARDTSLQRTNARVACTCKVPMLVAANVDRVNKPVIPWMINHRSKGSSHWINSTLCQQITYTSFREPSNDQGHVESKEKRNSQNR